LINKIGEPDVYAVNNAKHQKGACRIYINLAFLSKTMDVESSMKQLTQGFDSCCYIPIKVTQNKVYLPASCKKHRTKYEVILMRSIQYLLVVVI
jgi:hypothetical protein